MNIHTFKDAVSSKRATFADEIQDDDDDEREAAPLRRAVEGEEEDAKEQVEC
jgi:Sec-independent protein translocase protein TatA